MRRSIALAALALAAIALPGASVAGSYLPPPGDTRPSWSPDGERIAFLTLRSGMALVDVPANGGAETRLVEGIGVLGAVISPDWRWLAFLRYEPDGQSLWVSRLDGSGARLLTTTAPGAEPVWSPDSRGLIFRRGDGALALVDLEGGMWTLVPTGGFDAAFSPDGRRFAFAAVGPDGLLDLFVSAFSDGVSRALAGGPGAQVEPKWSPDGTRIAFLTQPKDGAAFRLGIVRADGSGLVTYPGPGLSIGDSLAWMPAGDAIVLTHGLSQGIVRLDLRTGMTTRLRRSPLRRTVARRAVRRLGPGSPRRPGRTRLRPSARRRARPSPLRHEPWHDARTGRGLGRSRRRRPRLRDLHRSG